MLSTGLLMRTYCRVAYESEKPTPLPAAPVRDVNVGTTRHPLLGVAVPHGRRSGAARGQPSARVPTAHWAIG